MLKTTFAHSSSLLACFCGFTYAFANSAFINPIRDSNQINEKIHFVTDTLEIDSIQKKIDISQRLRGLFELKKPIERINSFQYGLWLGN